MDRFTGGCLCGNLRIVASGRPYRVGLCHCLDCRKIHRALFSASAVFPADALTIEGETRDDAGRSFCPRCGKPFKSGGRQLGPTTVAAVSRDEFDDASKMVRRDLEFGPPIPADLGPDGLVD